MKNITIENIKENKNILDVISLNMVGEIDPANIKDGFILGLHDVAAARYKITNSMERDLYFIGTVLAALFDFSEDKFQVLLETHGITNVYVNLLPAVRQNKTLSFLYNSVEKNVKEKNNSGMLIAQSIENGLSFINEKLSELDPAELTPMLEQLSKITKDAETASKNFGIEKE